jgi:hypothetical protein
VTVIELVVDAIVVGIDGIVGGVESAAACARSDAVDPTIALSDRAASIKLRRL